MTTSPAAIYNRLHDIDRASLPAAARAEIESIMTEIMFDLRASAAKTTEANAAKMIRAMLKTNEGRREALAYAWIVNERGTEYQCMTDGFRAYRFRKHLDGLPMMPDEIKPIDLAKIYEPNVPRCRRRIEYTDREAVKAFIEIERARHGCRYTPEWDFGPGLPAVNAVYLYELLTIYPDAVLYADPDNILNPIYAVSEFGDAILLPLRSNNKTKAEAARQIIKEAEDNPISLDQFGTIAAAIAA